MSNVALSEIKSVFACREVLFAYEDGVEVLSGMSLEFVSGVPNYVVGPSGCGKTTLAMLLADALKPLSGSIVRPSDFAISLVLQFPENLFLADTIEEEFATLPDVIAEEVALATLARFDLRFADVARQSPHRLSFGQRRMLAIAIQSSLSKIAIVLDEPTLGLDEIHLKQIADWLTERCADGTLCIVITHDLELLQSLPGNVCILESGKVQWQGTSSAFLARDDLLRLAGAV